MCFPWNLRTGGDLPSLQDLSQAAEAAAGGGHSPELRPSQRGAPLRGAEEKTRRFFFGGFSDVWMVRFSTTLWFLSK